MTHDELYITGRYAEANPTWHEEDSTWKADKVLRILDLKSARSPIRVCDIGCGAGGVLAAMGSLLEQRCIESLLVGYDIAPLAIRRARERWKERANIHFECLDASSASHLDYDICLLIDVLEHIADPEDFIVCLANKGISEFVIHLPLENNWLAIMRGRTDSRRSQAGHLRFYDTHSALSLFERSGLDVLEWVYTTECDLDIRLHRTLRSLLAYVPRKLMLHIWPALAVHTLGGASLLARCRPSSDLRQGEARVAN